MEGIAAIGIEIRSLKLDYRQSSIGLVKVGVGCCEDIYRQLSRDEDHFSMLTLLHLAEPMTPQEILEDGIQLEFYSDKSGLELICAGGLGEVGTLELLNPSEPGHKTRSNRNKQYLLEEMTVPMKFIINLYFKTAEAFGIEGGSVEVELRLFRILQENVIKATSTCNNCNLAENGHHKVIIKVPMQSSADFTDTASDVDFSDISSLNLQQYESDDNSVDDFVQSFLTNSNRNKAATVATLRESLQSVETVESVQSQLSSLKKKLGTKNSADDVSAFRYRKPKKTQVPHYMLPARTPPFHDMLRKR